MNRQNPCISHFPRLLLALLIVLSIGAPASASPLAAGEGSISGAIYAHDGVTPIPNAAVTLVDESWTDYYHTVTDNAGAYQSPALPPGNYLVWVEAAGYPVRYYPNADTSYSAALVAVSADSSVANINIVITQKSSISGRVFAPDGVTPLRDVWVYMYTAEGMPYGGAQVDPQGRYSFSLLDAGSYLLGVEDASGYPNQYYHDAFSLDDATPIQVNPPQDTPNIDIVMREGGSIRGRVFATDRSTPLSGATVRAIPVGGSDYFQTTTDAAGNYTLTALKGSDYYVTAYVSGDTYAQEFYDDVNDIALASPVAVTLGKETSGINFYLDRIAWDMIDTRTGGVLPRSGEAPFRVDFPAGLAGDGVETLILAKARYSTQRPALPYGLQQVGPSLVISSEPKIPEFSKPITLSLDYTDACEVRCDPTTLKIIRFDADTSRWVALSTTLDPVTKQAEAESTRPGHFVLTAIAPLYLPLVSNR